MRMDGTVYKTHSAIWQAFLEQILHIAADVVSRIRDCSAADTPICKP